jgi:hypothetical protein
VVALLQGAIEKKRANHEWTQCEQALADTVP